MQFASRLRLFLFLSSVLWAPALSGQNCDYTLSGRSVDEHNGEALGYARITIAELETGAISDSNGYYSIPALCAGTYTVQCTHIGCEPVTAKVKISGNTVYNFYPEHHADLIGTVVIDGKIPEEITTRNVTLLSKREMAETKGQSLGDALKTVTGVTTLNTGNSISKPVIHGLHSNRLLIMNNGVRQEGQQWGNEHAPEIDPFLADQLAVVKGAGSVRYGPDAIAGVILVDPRPLRDSAGIGGEVNLTGFSNGRQGAASVMLDGNLARVPALSWRLQGTVKRGGNVHTSRYFLKNTGVAEYNYSAAVGYSKRRYGLEVFFSAFNTDLGIFSGAHIGNLTDLQAAFEAEVPLVTSGFSYQIGRPYQHVTHNLLKAKAFLRTGTVGKLSFTYAQQYNLRFEYDKDAPRNDSLEALNRPELQFEIRTHTVQIEWEHFRRHGFKGQIGLSGIYQGNSYQGRFFIPNFRKYGGGLYWTETWRPDADSRLELEAGIRYDYLFQRIFMRRDGLVVTPDFAYHNLSGSLGGRYHFTDQLTLRATAGTSWRPPGVNELFSDGLHHGAAAVEIGDSTLNLEQAYSYSIGAEYTSTKLDVFVDAYANYFSNFIYLVPELPPTLTIRGAFPTFRYRQVEALLAGVDLTVRYRFAQHFEYTGKVATLRARNRTTNEFLVQMPADRFENSLAYQLPELGSLRSVYASATLVNVLRQSRVPDNSDFVVPPAGYALVGLQLGADIPCRGHAIQVGVGVNNLLNVSYRDYLNRFRYYADDIGRNFSFRIKVPFEIVSSNR